MEKITSPQQRSDNTSVWDTQSNRMLLSVDGMNNQMNIYGNIKMHFSSRPLLKQTDSTWGSITYDGADLWSRGTECWGLGCAITSATMVLQYNGIQKLPDGSALIRGHELLG